MTLDPDTIELWVTQVRRNADSHTARGILAAYLDQPASAVQIARSPGGKPVVSSPSAVDAGLRFSLSHARGTLVVAVGLRELGLDVESTLGLADRTLEPLRAGLTAGERATLDAIIDEPTRRRATLVCWTRKEAYAKADGAGLAIGTTRYEVSCGPGVAPALLRFDERPDEPARWHLLDLPPIANVVGTLAVAASPPRPPPRLRVRIWDDRADASDSTWPVGER